MGEERAQFSPPRIVAMFVAEAAATLGAHLALTTVGTPGFFYLLAHVNDLPGEIAEHRLKNHFSTSLFV